MGGPGSSRWGYYRGRTPENTAPAFSLRDGLEHDAGRVQWKRGLLETIVAEADYYIRPGDDGEKELTIIPDGGVEHRVRITRKHTGRRYFICPYCQEMPDEVPRR